MTSIFRENIEADWDCVYLVISCHFHPFPFPHIPSIFHANMSGSVALGVGCPCRCQQNNCKTTLVLQITYCILSHPSAQWFQTWLDTASQTKIELLNLECSSKIMANRPQLNFHETLWANSSLTDPHSMISWQYFLSSATKKLPSNIQKFWRILLKQFYPTMAVQRARSMLKSRMILFYINIQPYSNVHHNNHINITILEVLRAYQRGLGSAFSFANPGWASFTCDENDRAWMGWKPAPGSKSYSLYLLAVWPFNAKPPNNARGCQYNTMYAKNTEEKSERYDMAITV